jgi:hypothetical protein
VYEDTVSCNLDMYPVKYKAYLGSEGQVDLPSFIYVHEDSPIIRIMRTDISGTFNVRIIGYVWDGTYKETYI